MPKILLATDGSDYSLQSLKKFIPMAKAMDADLTVLTVVEEMPFLKSSDGMTEKEAKNLLASVNKEAEQGLQKARKLFEEVGLRNETKMASGKPGDTICREIEEGDYDLVVVGDSGLGGITELFLGSVSNKVAHCAKTDVLILKRLKG